ncbi:metal-dependent hydrolase [Agromyces larvae]|uniref:Metal-dependent hydrolase n=1 Tax=Agromyces larvae TaxID=2929802 RepID=A0ABY4C1U9_9MICO|nr:metal-dependent hydrolase [Agromyces larvae]UOE45455.1 metal-dependent hydrolase [Agromyces larvae]
MSPGAARLVDGPPRGGPFHVAEGRHDHGFGTVMMGITHATSGAAAWVALTSTMPVLTLGAHPLDPTGVLAGAAVCAGAALLPDADHRSATIAQSVPVLGRLATSVVGELTGGHRHGAHSALAVMVVAVASWALSLVVLPAETLGIGSVGTALGAEQIALGAGAGTAALTAFGLRARDFVASWPLAWFCGLLLGTFIALLAPQQAAWFPLAVTAGFAVHLLGDLLTVGGLPGLLWPWVPRPPRSLRPVPVLRLLWLPNGYIALPLLGRTGSTRETLFGMLLALYAFAGSGWECLVLLGVEPALGAG